MIDKSLLIFHSTLGQSKEQRSNAALVEKIHVLFDSRKLMVECSKVAEYYRTTSCLRVSSLAYLRKVG